MSIVSVVVPIYRVEPYLYRCVDSILAQTLTDFDLILVDDGSPDRCGAICDEYAKKDARVHVIHQKNGGLSAARNAGIDWAFAHSDSQWLSFIDSDDWVHPQYLKWLYQTCIEYDTETSVCGYERTGVEHIEELSDFRVKVYRPEDLWVTQYGETVIACGKLWKKTLFSQIRFPLAKQAEDLFITPQIVFVQEQIAFIHEKLYYYYQNTASIMNAAWSLKKLTMIEAHEKQLAFFRENKFMKAYQCQKEHYCLTLASQISELANSNMIIGRKKYMLLLRKKLKVSMGKFGKKTIQFTPETQWVYDAAYPQMMKVYWLWKAFQGKVKRLRRD